MESAVALYFRLSQEDVDARGNSLKDESNSIQSQRFMLRSFIANHPGSERQTRYGICG